jgi:hypothetical protein
MNYKDFMKNMWGSKKETPVAATMSAPSEARQRIEAKQAAIQAKLDASYNK